MFVVHMVEFEAAETLNDAQLVLLSINEYASS